jgi:hypothetical protein
VTESETRASIDIASGPIREGRAVGKREGTKVKQSEKGGKSADSPQRHDAALPRDCQDSSGHNQTSIQRILLEWPLEGSRCTEHSRAEDSCDGEGGLHSLSSDSAPKYCSRIDRWVGERSISKGSMSHPDHSYGARTCCVEVGYTPRSSERHRRHRSEWYMCLCRRGTSC